MTSQPPTVPGRPGHPHHPHHAHRLPPGADRSGTESWRPHATAGDPDWHPQHAAPDPRPRVPRPVLLAAAATGVALIAVGVALLSDGGTSPGGGGGAGDAAAATPPAPPSTNAAVPADPTVAGPGIWRVGEQIEPGTYRVVAEAARDCYWARLHADGLLIDNGLGGGRPTVTLEAGEQFQTSGCPDFKKQ
ncbi:hypothetical protein [Spirilliplanes yamanashiensis]|uniref:Uncharacterized protein n=1 Tax=Spirilliplanes yamanashiensis TaxID=42233 RepID=A0A8J3Y4U9_9ACTN|nr:hypothetical protein [Spirilliplanes yamanashiensis]MDP9819385.1 hypothetical protein [Spirilliplanes yamanashiensis]GIJ01791.1 hypothetical protein Sya03_11430 [Spirilliplanes yamanashiensis]